MKDLLLKFIFTTAQKIYPFYSDELELKISRTKFINYLKLNTESGFGNFYDHSKVINYNYPKNEKKYECVINKNHAQLREVLTTENVRAQFQRPVFSIIINDNYPLVVKCKMRQSTFLTVMTVILIFGFFYFLFIYFFQRQKEIFIYSPLFALTLYSVFNYIFKIELDKFLTFIKNAVEENGY